MNDSCINSLSRFDGVPLARTRPKGPGICLAQAEGLGNGTTETAGPTAWSFAKRWTNARAVGPLSRQLLHVPRPSAWARQIPGPSGRLKPGCTTSRLAIRAVMALLILVGISNADERGDYLTKYREHVAASELSQNVRSEIDELLDADKTDSTEDVLSSAIAISHKGFLAALESYEDGKIDVATKQLAVLADSDSEFVASEAKYLLARCLVEQNDHEAALPHLKDLSPVRAATGLFLRGVCQANMLDREAAIESFAQFMRDHPSASERQRIAAWRQLELLSLIEEGSLVDVYQKMDYARRRLALERANEPTQTRQKETIGILDKLIEQAEEREAMSESESKKESQGKKKAGSKAGKGAGKEGPGEGTDDKTPMKTVRQVQQGAEATPWDHVRDKKRDAKALAAIKEKYPARYRALIEQYYRSLQEEAGE